MELLELKSVWDVVVEETISKERVDEIAVEKSIKRDSKSVLAKIKKVMLFKFALGGLCLLLCLVMLIGSFVNPEKFTFYEGIFDITDNRIFLATIILFMVAMLSWNFKAFREIAYFETNASTVKQSLKRFIDIIARVIRFNIYFGVSFNSAAFGWICYLLNNRKGYVDGILQITLMVFAAVVFGAVVFYFLSRYEQKLKFGNYLKQLMVYRKELEGNIL